MGVGDCHNFQQFRKLAKRRLPGPIFHYIDGAADDEQTYQRNTAAYGDVDLIPSVLNDVSEVDMSVEVMGQKLDMPLYCAPTALQRLFHHEGERAVAKAATKYGTMFGVSSLATVTVEEIAKIAPGPKMFQFYFHKDRGLNDALLERARDANFEVMALTVDTITGGNRERDLHTGFTSPPKLSLSSLISFALHPQWAFNFYTKEPFDMPHLSGHVQQGTNVAVSVGNYFSSML
ncbi:MAG: alpha-hydroxy acid oxidase, partial [Pseudomonadota bacterium]